MTLDELKKLIADDEGETVEVKETTGQRVDACETRRLRDAVRVPEQGRRNGRVRRDEER